MLKYSFISISFFLLMVISFNSCKDNQSSTDDNASPIGNSRAHETNVYNENVLPISTLLRNAEKNLTNNNINKLFNEISRQLREPNIDDSKKKELLKDAAGYAKKFKKDNIAVSFYTGLLKDYPDEKESNNYIFELAQIMKSLKMTSASDVMFDNFVKLYPNDKRVKDAKNNISSSYKNIESYLKEQADIAYKKRDGVNVDKKVVQKYVNACEAYALSNPHDKLTPSYLYKGSELARGIKSINKVINLYDWIINKYPDFEKSATVYFLKGFIIDNETKNIESAKKAYEKFLEKYPDNKLASDVKFLIKNLGKTNDEILKQLEKGKN